MRKEGILNTISFLVIESVHMWVRFDTEFYRFARQERRRESTCSRTSNSSTTSDRMMSAFLQSAKKLRGTSSRSHSLTDHFGSDDEAADQRYTISSDSLSDPAQDQDFPTSDMHLDPADSSSDAYQLAVHTPAQFRPHVWVVWKSSTNHAVSVHFTEDLHWPRSLFYFIYI